MTTPFTAGQKVRASTLNSLVEDTGWVALAADGASGFTGVTGWQRRVGKVVDVTFIGAKVAIYPAAFTMATLAVGNRPTVEEWRIGSYWGSTAHFAIKVQTDGKIVHVDSSVSSRNGAVFGFTITI